MSGRRILAITRRIADQFRRDRRTLALLFVVPIFVTALLGWVLRGQGTDTTRVGIVAPTIVAAAVGAKLDQAQGVDYVLQADTEDAGRQAIRDGRADVVLVLPPGFTPAQVAAGTGAPVTLTVLVPGVDPGADGRHVIGLQQAVLRILAPTLPTIQRETVWGSPTADALDSFAPALIGFFGFFFVFLLTGISFLRERVGGTLERLLATPVTRAEIVAGYSLGFCIFATLQVALITTFSLMDVRVPAIGPIPEFGIGLGIANAGSPLIAFLVVLLLAVGMVNLGVFVSTFARTELQVIQFVPIVIVPQALLSGILVPTSQLPDLLRPISQVLPLTYAVEGLREVVVKGADFASATLRLDLAVLVVVAIVFAGLAGLTIRREVA